MGREPLRKLAQSTTKRGRREGNNHRIAGFDRSIANPIRQRTCAPHWGGLTVGTLDHLRDSYGIFRAPVGDNRQTGYVATPDGSQTPTGALSNSSPNWPDYPACKLLPLRPVRPKDGFLNPGAGGPVFLNPFEQTDDVGFFKRFTKH